MGESNHRDKKQEGRTEHQNDVLNTQRTDHKGQKLEKLKARNTVKSNRVINTGGTKSSKLHM